MLVEAAKQTAGQEKAAKQKAKAHHHPLCLPSPETLPPIPIGNRKITCSFPFLLFSGKSIPNFRGIEMAAPTSSDRARTNWTPTMERYFIDLMLDQMHKGNRLGHTFNKQAWTDMLTVFNAKFGCKYDRDTLKSHYTILWKQYNDVKNLLDQNGFAWDDTHKIVIAPPHVWDAYIKSQPDAQMYRSKNLNNFNDLCLIYAYTQADGRYSRSSHDLDFDDDNQGVNFGSIPSASNEHPKIEWTPAMEQYFIELMLDQIKKGNKSNDTFNRQGWKDILTSFNTKFCSQYGKSFLNRRLKKLSKYYSEVQCLLQQKGFSWDETEQMIMADDGLWDKYIKVHPDARTYRTKRLLNYHDLLLIFGNASNNGLGGCMRHRRNIESRTLPVNTGQEKKGCPFDRSDSLNICWTPEMDRYLIDLLLDQALRGNKIGHVFIPEAWSEIETDFNERFGSHHDKGVLKNRSRFFRRQHNDIKSLRDQNGFSWDDTQEMVTAEDYVWDYYVKAHPSAQSYRKKSVPNYHKLCVIYGEERSNGLCSYLDQTVDLAHGDSDLMIGDDTQLLANEDSPSRDWTSLMDRHLIDLLLEQVHKGNRTKHTFNSEAWIEMVLSFMDRFGLQLDEDLLRNHHKSLGQLYHNMKILLDQGGFSWDETRQMITAHEVVWDTHIKEHPDAESYRNKSKPNYYDLCLIYGNSTYDGKGSQSEQDASYNGNGIKLSNGNGNSNGYCWRTDWTPPMDRFFIDLMLEQVYQGSMIHKKFNRHAWDDIVRKFREEFGHQYSKGVLKSRFINLRRQFIDMKILLDQRGFGWDRMRCMIVADDFLWDAYVKEHPDARTYQNRTLPSYDDLFLIFRDANNGEHFDAQNFALKEDYESPASSSGPVEGLYGSESVNIEPDIGNDTLDNGFHDIFGGLQSLAAEFEISDLRKKRKPYDSSMSVFPRKAQKPYQDIQEAFDENTSIFKTQFTCGEDRSYSSIENIVDALQDVPGMDDELFLEASKLLEEEKNAKKFLAMDVNQRRKWLRRKLCQ